MVSSYTHFSLEPYMIISFVNINIQNALHDGSMPKGRIKILFLLHFTICMEEVFWSSPIELSLAYSTCLRRSLCYLSDQLDLAQSAFCSMCSMSVSQSLQTSLPLLILGRLPASNLSNFISQLTIDAGFSDLIGGQDFSVLYHRSKHIRKHQAICQIHHVYTQLFQEPTGFPYQI